MSERRITVAVRIRPKLSREQFDAPCCFKTDDTTLTLSSGDDENAVLGGAQAHHGSNAASFGFDSVFDEADDQRTFYEDAAVDMVDFALQGGNATIFAYGQTGSGKTHTILGEVSPQGEITSRTGLFLRAFDDIFRYRDKCFRQKSVIVALTAVELYVDDVFDLLQERKKVKVRDGGQSGGVQLSGARSYIVRSLSDVVELFTIANSLRSVKATKMNNESSRSHALFLIDVFQAAKQSGSQGLTESSLFDAQGDLLTDGQLPNVIRSRICLVDLAGSERLKRSGVEGQEKVEAAAINKSLSTLGTVIAGMHEGSSHVPFRDSKLTLVLRPSLTDRTARLLLIGQLAPTSDSFQESHGTTKFCDRVKSLPAASESPLIDAQEELAYLASVKRQAEASADLRIVKEIHRSTILDQSNASDDAVVARLVGGALNWVPQRIRRSRTSQPNPYHLPSRPLKDNEVQVAAAVETESMATTTKRLSREQQQLQQQEYQEAVTDLVAPNRLQRKTLEKSFATQMARHEELEQDLADMGDLQEKEATEKLTEAKRAKKKRVTHADAREKLLATVEELQAELANLKDQCKIAEKQQSTSSILSAEEEEQWEDFEDNWKTLESNHQIVREFAIHWRAVHGMHKDFVQTRYKVHKGEQRIARDEAKVSNEGSSSASSATAIREMMADLSEFLVERAVEISHGHSSFGDSYSWALDVKGMSKRLLPAHAWSPRPLDVTNPLSLSIGKVEPLSMTTNETSPDVSSSPIDYGSVPSSPTSAAGPNPGLVRSTSLRGTGRNVPLSAGHTATQSQDDTSSLTTTPTEGGLELSHEAAAKQAREKRRNLRAEGGGVTKKYDSDEADKHYLMTVYDSKTLVPDVIKYLCAGSNLTKHGRSGDPHVRRVWISNVSSVREIVWVDPEALKKYEADTNNPSAAQAAAARAANKEKFFVAVSNISSIVLGQYSKVFKRNGGNPKNKDFFLSFTLHTKDNSRTLDLVAPTLVDFEAWVLGLAHMTRIQPIWGKNLDCSKDENVHRLTPGEKALCENQNIFPTVFVSLKERLIHHRSEVLLHLRLFEGDERQGYEAMGGIHAPQKNEKDAVLVTKGELRYFGSKWDLDIFRVCKLFELFRDQHIIYDTAFTPAVNFPSVTAQTR